MRRKASAVFIINQLLRIAVIRTDKHLPVRLLQSVHSPAHAGVYRADRFYRRVKHSGMPNHVRICKIDNNYVVLAGFDCFYQLIAYGRRAHFRLQIIRRNLRGID